MAVRWTGTLLVLAAGVLTAAWAQTPPAGPGGGKGRGGADCELVERVLAARRDYHRALESLRAHYIKAGDMENAKWTEEELRGFHLVPHPAYNLDLDLPPGNLQGTTNILEANKLYTEALQFKDRGWGQDYQLNQRRAELLFQKILTQYPQSNKISDVAYQLGDIYESKAYHQYRRSALYFERCFQWNAQTHFDARLRAARLYDRQLKERARALEIYREVKQYETDPRRLQEADKRIADLSGGR